MQQGNTTIKTGESSAAVEYINTNQEIKNLLGTKRIYICGKVTGIPYPMVSEKFYKAELLLTQLGYKVINPVMLVGNTEMDWQQAMRVCIKALMECDAIYMLPCWSKSRGAILEKHIAANIGIDIIEAEKIDL